VDGSVRRAGPQGEIVGQGCLLLFQLLPRQLFAAQQRFKEGPPKLLRNSLR
jgi:hypothetical protein